jgi:hypothetical protein
MSESKARAVRQARQAKAEQNGQPDPRGLELTMDEVRLVYACLSQGTFQGAVEKIIAGQLQAKIEQFVGQPED